MTRAVTFELDGGEADARRLRDAFGCFTTGVTIVTTRGEDGEPVGFTANAFASVSLTPPLVLVCVDLAANSLPALKDAGVFVVNVLHAGQEEMARLFASPGVHRFKDAAHGAWKTGAPVLDGCMANFECATEQAFDAGDHRIFIGRVVQVRMDPDHAPLVFLRGDYCEARTG